ncbi:MAG: FAD-dependent oxidoreductase [Janthinobacterium lividum]
MFALTPARLAVLHAVADTLLPPGPHHLPPGSALIDFAKLAATIQAQPLGAQAEFARLLDLLGRPLAGLTWLGPLRPFPELAPAQRERLLQSWATSRLAPLRKGFHALRQLCLFLYYGDSPAAGGPNPAWASLGYPGPNPADDQAPVAAPQRLHLLAPTADVTYTCDVLVIGSGAGGGVVAGELAAAGHDVLVLEKGPYRHGTDFTGREADMLGQLYEARASLLTEDGSVGLLAGSCLGGGTTVNWAGAFRTPDYILDEWAREHDAPFFTGPDFARSLDAVAAALSVNTDYAQHNGQNQALRDGSARLGQATRLIPRNERGLGAGLGHFRGLGFSSLGDAHGIKQGTLNTYLPLASAHGARLLPGTRAERVTVVAGRATGAVATHTTAGGRAVQVQVRARRVVVAGGAVHTPALLLRSGLRHPHLGLHLHLHPTVIVAGRYPRPLHAWHGPSMSIVNDHFARLGGSNYGVKLETPPTHPGLLSIVLPWLGGQQHRALMHQASHLGSFIVLTRDRDGGRVRVDKQGAARIDYHLSAYDRAHLLAGVRGAAEIHAAAGAHTVYLPHGTLPTLGAENGRLCRPELLAQLPRLSWQPGRFGLFSAHQMSTCRLGGRAATHPLRPSGETVEVQGLYVADGAAFPACSGVNPMLTIMALAHYLAQGLK